MKRALLLLLLVAACDQGYEMRLTNDVPAPRCLEEDRDTYLLLKPAGESTGDYLAKARAQATKAGCSIDEEMTSNETGVVACCPQ